MALNSFGYYIFFFIVFILYYTVCKKKQNELLVLASVLFMLMQSPFCLILLSFVIFATYGMVCFIDRKEYYKKRYAITATIVLLGMLAVFKYLRFGVTIWNRAISGLGISLQILPMPILDILLPVGISFYVFQSIGYVWDVYYKRAYIEKDFLKYFLFISYFPKIAVGPIERAERFMPQLEIGETTREFSYKGIVTGLRLIMIGLFKKTAVADVVSPLVSNVFDNPGGYTGFPLIMATILYTLQIYCDFSGYADLAVGFSKMLGIDLIQNFQTPYLSKSISEFWRKWHVSLSSWFRDFVYIPLGGNRVSKFRHIFNTMVTFLLSGLWHGASFNFLVWGGVHGTYLCIENLVKGLYQSKKKPSSEGMVSRIIKQVLVFTCISIAWIFFRATSLRSAVYILTHLFSNLEFSASYIKGSLVLMGFTKKLCVVVSISLIILIVVDVVQFKRGIVNMLDSNRVYVRWGIYFLFAFYILFCKMYMAESQQFIYFQF